MDPEKETEARHAAISRGLLLLCVAVFLILFVLAPEPRFEPWLRGSRRWVCGALGAGALLALVVSRRAPQWRRAAVTAYASLVLLLVVTSITSFSFSVFLWRQLDQLSATFQRTGLRMVSSPLFKRVLARNQDVTLTTSDYRFRFRTDDSGRRVSPPTRARTPERIVFLGSSWTFGLGVEDEETFVYRTGVALADRFETVNLAHVGWGLQEALPRLLDLLAREPEVPVRFVLLEWFPGLSGALRGGGDPGRAPSFLLPDNLPANLRLPFTEALEKDLIRLVHDVCKRRGIGFALLAVHTTGGERRLPRGVYEEMLAYARSARLPYIDVSDIPSEAPLSSHDVHPGPEWHAAVATKLTQYLSQLPSSSVVAER